MVKAFQALVLVLKEYFIRGIDLQYKEGDIIFDLRTAGELFPFQDQFFFSLFQGSP